eukprot:gnl/TRDRNA2_/TRDRNA2_142021_c0_seq1.p1 gnl/TRDRNA2_/TRDRNA2_142021_c0~~gnl/TRDRNA2_/TRDRNA2_142021_c0_seq1.p1  ORF type:complete len:320 (+),score=45.80 gnl/TRDRNA2_/TRDRNA2_142021_c0_seq1:70-1029(+)
MTGTMLPILWPCRLPLFYLLIASVLAREFVEASSGAQVLQNMTCTEDGTADGGVNLLQTRMSIQKVKALDGASGEQEEDEGEDDEKDEHQEGEEEQVDEEDKEDGQEQEEHKVSDSSLLDYRGDPSAHPSARARPDKILFEGPTKDEDINEGAVGKLLSRPLYQKTLACTGPAREDCTECISGGCWRDCTGSWSQRKTRDAADVQQMAPPGHKIIFAARCAGSKKKRDGVVRYLTVIHLQCNVPGFGIALSLEKLQGGKLSMFWDGKEVTRANKFSIQGSWPAKDPDFQFPITSRQYANLTQGTYVPYFPSDHGPFPLA